MKQFVLHAVIIVVLCILSACSKDDNYYYPSVKLSFMTAVGDSVGAVSELISDKNEVYGVKTNSSNVLVNKDSTQRVVCYYEVYKEPTTDSLGSVKLYTLTKIICSTPRTGLIRVTDPVTIQSIWHNGNYINLTLGIMMQKGSHFFAFIQKSDTVNLSGNHTITVDISHDKNGDLEAFTRIVYLSIPLSSYIKSYPDGFTINVVIPTESGDTSYSFSIPATY